MPRPAWPAAMTLALWLWALPAGAAEVEFSFGLSFSRTNYGSPDQYTWARRWGLSLGYHFTQTSEVEVSFQDITDRTLIKGYEDTEFHDRIYSLNYVQSFLGKSSPVQPYVKAGIGQLNRDATGTYGSGGSGPNPRVDSLTGILGVGLRVYITRTFAIRAEVVSYLAGGAIGTWSDNFNTSIGASFFF